MQQLEIQFRAACAGGTQNERLASLFRAAPHRWLAMPELAAGIGAYAVHSRVADLRRRGMCIANRQRVNKLTRQRISEYRWFPESATAVQMLNKSE